MFHHKSNPLLIKTLTLFWRIMSNHFLCVTWSPSDQLTITLRSFSKSLHQRIPPTGKGLIFCKFIFAALQIWLSLGRGHGQAHRGQEVLINLNPSRHSSGWASSSRKDLHFKETLQIPQLDRNQYESKTLPWFMYANPVIWVVPALG